MFSNYLRSLYFLAHPWEFYNSVELTYLLFIELRSITYYIYRIKYRTYDSLFTAWYNVFLSAKCFFVLLHFSFVFNGHIGTSYTMITVRLHMLIRDAADSIRSFLFILSFIPFYVFLITYCVAFTNLFYNFHIIFELYLYSSEDT